MRSTKKQVDMFIEQPKPEQVSLIQGAACTESTTQSKRSKP